MIDLVAMKQTNKVTRYQRDIIKEEAKDHKPRYWWFVEADSNPAHALE